LNRKKLPFESPPPQSPTAGEIATTVAGGIVVLAAAAVLKPFVSIFGVADLFLPAEPPPPFDVERALRQVGAPLEGPPRDERGFVECTRCSAFVPYASMSLNEEGYFCRVCAAALTQQALADTAPTDFDY
jgi:hypothetical protein